MVEDDGVGRVAVAKVSMATPVDGTAENQGSCLKFSQLNSVFQGEKASAMEGMDGPSVGDDDQSPGMAGLGVFNGALIQMVSRPMTQLEDSGLLNQIEDNGPLNLVKQSRWSRLTRMDLGLVDLFKEGAKSILGKRGSQCIQQEIFDKGDEQAEKKAKSKEGSEIFEAAGVLQHPCREQ